MLSLRLRTLSTPLLCCLEIFMTAAIAVSSPCPCKDKSLCKPISGPPVNVNGELFGFYGNSPNKGMSPGEGMNWTYITTVAWASEDEIMCLAHANGARAVIASPPFDLDSLAEPSARKEWSQKALKLVQESYRDGIVFDYEHPEDVGSKRAETYAAVIAETRNLFHSVNPSLQISTCVAWSPDDIDGRGYPTSKLADASDLLYVMDYDTRSQIYDSQCIAGPNAPYPGMVKGIERYFDIGISPSKLVLGVPWYGYRYECLPGTSPDAVYCPIKHVPFRGVNCSDAAGSEMKYAYILKALERTDTSVTGGLQRDSNTGDPYFNAIEKSNGGDATVVQYWFDDSYSLRAKYKWAARSGLAGIGPFTFGDLDPTQDTTLNMWRAIESFFEARAPASVVAETS